MEIPQYAHVPLLLYTVSWTLASEILGAIQDAGFL